MAQTEKQQQTSAQNATKQDWLNPPKTIQATLCYISRICDDENKEASKEYLLLLKSKGKFGEGFWNAPGGKIEPNENPEQAAKREVLEETGLELKELKKAGSLEFYFGRSKLVPDWQVTVFTCTHFEGTLSFHHSDEGELKWFREEALPYDKMWADDTLWLPLLIQGVAFHGVFVFSEDSKELLSSSITLL